ncbi:hypothetical protein COS77_01955 [Candidatus Roizmanbacteria bacterium CG06_land_8_20_14_3_00_34_14]|uniref:Glycoside hydrolase family 5 domain-containing protein n=2 Tax=Candidatus Roizmaniibacteriota TaxID=1752723 RepID=A0A2M7AUT3_9BACT|nr:MAG: hypothetical protein COS77_01955 [Candidatus Roizmanbacteria bacterium CG06_land_8_20_14_3_00_34_14]
MKKLLLILITVEILLIFLFPLILKKNPQEKLGLHINGKYFETENGRRIQLKGISTMAFVRYDYDIRELIKIFEIFKGYKINLITLYISPDKVYKDQAKLDYLIEWAKNNSIYIYLLPTIDTSDATLTIIQEKIVLTKKLSLEMIKRYKRENNIIYGVWAEPFGVNWEEWKSYHREFIDKAVAINKKVVLGISGLNNGRSFMGNFDFSYKNIFLDFHDYPAANTDQLKKMQIKKFLWDKYVNKYAVLIGEFGGVYKEGFGTEEDKDYFQTVINQANQKKISYVAYTIDPIDKEGGLSLVDWKTKGLTKKGEIFVKSLLNN